LKTTMRVLVTGSAGFIGSAVSERLLNSGEIVCGADNHNDYYSVALKEQRLARLEEFENYSHSRIELADSQRVRSLFESFRPTHVLHLAAQAGVRYSLENPSVYIQSNIVAFANVIELSKEFAVEHFIYASSSSVYGGNEKQPFSETDDVSRPLSLYAATKRSNELLAHTYSHLFNLPTTGLRFFTVYGPWGRPDMALYKFTKSILADEPIQLFNSGNHRRDFTYVDDIVDGVIGALETPPIAGIPNSIPASGNSTATPSRLINLGSGQPIELGEYVRAIESATGKQARVVLLPAQPGDVKDTFADITIARSTLGYQPRFSVQEGVDNFVQWFRTYSKNP